MIKPTVGRIVLFRPAGPDGPTQAAIVCGVNSDTNVNLSVFGLYGEGPTAHRSVRLRQDGEPTPDYGQHYCEWMPYQLGQAARTEAAEAKSGA